MLIIIVETSCFNDLTISLIIKKLIFAKIRPGKSSVPLLKHFCGIFRWEQISYFWRVSTYIPSKNFCKKWVSSTITSKTWVTNLWTFVDNTNFLFLLFVLTMRTISGSCLVPPSLLHSWFITTCYGTGSPISPFCPSTSMWIILLQIKQVSHP